MKTKLSSHIARRFLAFALVLLSVATVASAKEGTFVLDSIAIRKSPLEIPYYFYVEVAFKDQKAVMRKPQEVNATQGLNQEIKFSEVLKLDNVPERQWATVTVRMDNDPEQVKTFKAAYSNTAKVPMIATSTKPTVVMPQEGVWEYVLRWHMEGM